MAVGLKNLLWSARGYDWGFRILRHPDERQNWLHVYENVFRFGMASGNEPLFKCIDIKLGSRTCHCIALRLLDPKHRKDISGRAILHEFIIFDPDVSIESLEEAHNKVWLLVESEYEEWYDNKPPLENEDDDLPNKNPRQWSAVCILAIIVIGILIAISLFLAEETGAVAEKAQQKEKSSNPDSKSLSNLPVPGTSIKGIFMFT
jgi:hypothetical protein